MTDQELDKVLDLAVTFGGYTSLDRSYLAGRLRELTAEEGLATITPPPSVLNAYFAEMYQKKGQEAAMDYYRDLSLALDLTQEQPTFAEDKPFVRLALSGKSYGLAFLPGASEALVFAELAEDWTADFCLDLAQLFPHLLVKLEADGPHLVSLDRDLEDLTPLALDNFPLSQAFELASGGVKLQSYNKEELLELAQTFSGQETYYGYGQRAYVIYRF